MVEVRVTPLPIKTITAENPVDPKVMAERVLPMRADTEQVVGLQAVVEMIT